MNGDVIKIVHNISIFTEDLNQLFLMTLLLCKMELLASHLYLLKSEENFVLHVIQYEQYQIGNRQRHTDRIAKVVRKGLHI